MSKIMTFLLTLCLICTSCSGRNSSKEELLKEGLALLNEKGNPNGAIVMFKSAIEKDQNFFEARLNLAKAYMAAGKADSAEKELQKASRLKPESRDVRIELAKSYLQQAKPDEALKEIKGYFNDETKDADVLEIAGWAHSLKGDHSTAISLLKKAVENSDRPATAITLAKVYIRMGKPEEAEEYMSALLKKEPSSRAGLYTLAEIQTVRNKFDAAIDTYEKIIKENPNDIEAILRKGMLYINIGKLDQALSISDELIGKSKKRPEGYRLKGMALFYKKDFKEATIELQKSVSIQPNVGSYYLLGLCHYYRNELEQALNHLSKTLEVSPDFIQARIVTALILMKKNQIDDAISEIRKALEKDDKNAFAHNILGSAYMSKGMYQQGMAELNKAVELDPKLVDVHIKKGLFELKKGRFSEAEISLKTAVQVAPETVYSRMLLATYYIQRNEFKKAIETAKQGIKGSKEDAIYYNLIAETLLKQNNNAEAIGYLEKAKATNPEFDVPYFNLSLIYLQKGDHEKGVKELKDLVSKSPSNLKALFGLATFHELKGMKEEALRFYKQAKDTGKPEGFIEFAKYYLKNRENDKALQILDEAIKKNPSDMPAYELKGITLLMQKKYDDAIKTYESLEKINAKAGFQLIVNAYIEMKKPEKALDRVMKELKKNPDSPELMAEISRIYMIMNKKQDAVENARKIIQRKPDSPVGHLALASIFGHEKEPDKAIDVLNKTTVKDININVMTGDLYLMKKDNKNALKYYQMAKEMNPEHIPAVFRYGTVLHSTGKNKEAISEYQKVLRLNQNYVPALNNLAYIYADDNLDLSSALQMATRAYVIAPNDGSVMDTFGYVLLKNKKTIESLNVLKKAIDILPDNPSVNYHLALAYKESGEKGKSIEYLQKAISKGNFPEAKQAKELMDRLKRG